jgi:hypothetical protein
MTRVAVVQDHAARTWAAVARLEHPGIGMAEADERDRMAAGLAELQEIASRAESIDLFAIQVRTVPDDGAERADWVRRHRKPTAPPLARQVNDTLTTHLMPAAVRSEAFVTVVVSEERIARAAREAGGGIDGRARVLYGAMGEVEARLCGAIGCTEVTWLDCPALASVIRTGFAPGDRAALVAAQLAARDDPRVATGLPMAAAGPSTASTEMRHYHHDAWCSITDTILLPDQGAILGALAPVFVPSTSGERRSVTVFYPAMSQAKADKLTGREEMSAIVGAELRRRSGRLERARQRPPRSPAWTRSWPRAGHWCGPARPPPSLCPTPGRSPSTGAAWTPRSAWPGSSPSVSTAPKTRPSSPAPSRSASASRAGAGSADRRRICSWLGGTSHERAA